MSLLAVAFDEARTESAGRILTKRICAVIRDAVEPLAPGQMGRYDDDYEERAFGDNVTKWGTPVVLIETGAGPAIAPDECADPPELRRAAHGPRRDRVRARGAAAAARYESLPKNGDRLFHTLITNATLVPGTGVAPFTSDIGVVAQRTVRVVDGERRMGISARIDDLGDLRVYGALETIDATGLVVAPLVDQSVDARAPPFTSTSRAYCQRASPWASRRRSCCFAARALPGSSPSSACFASETRRCPRGLPLFFLLLALDRPDEGRAAGRRHRRVRALDGLPDDLVQFEFGRHVHFLEVHLEDACAP